MMNSEQITNYAQEDRQGYDPKTGTYHEQFSWDSDMSLANTIVMAVTAVTGDEPTEIEPLYDVVDPHSLEAFLGSLRDSDDQHCGTVEFSFNDRAVTVGSHGEVCIECHPADDDPPR